MAHRTNPQVVCEILELFNAGEMDWQTAVERLQVSPAQLYRLRTQWLLNKKSICLKPSGGNHKEVWPEPVHQFLKEFLPVCKPLNYAVIADQLARRFNFERSRPAVADYIRQHFPKLIAQSQPGPKPSSRIAYPRRVSSASTVEFLGKTWKISPTNHKSIIIVHHHGSRFWVIPQTKHLSKWPDVLGSFSLKTAFSF